MPGTATRRAAMRYMWHPTVDAGSTLMHELAQHAVVAGGGTTARAHRWLWFGALTAFALAAWKMGVWVNHWYVAERLLNARAGGGPDGGDWWAAADLMSSGNRALVSGLFWFGVMAAFLTGVVVRRGRAARASVRH